MMNQLVRIGMVAVALATGVCSASADDEGFLFRVGTLTAESGGQPSVEARALVMILQHRPTSTYQVTSLTTPSGAELMPAAWYDRTLRGGTLVYGPDSAEAGTYEATLERGGETTTLSAELALADLLPLPEDVTVDAGDDGIVVTWNPVAGALTYEVSLLEPGAVLSTLTTAGTRVVFQERLAAGAYLAIVRAYSFAWAGTPEDPIEFSELPDRPTASEVQVRFDIDR